MTDSDSDSSSSEVDWYGWTKFTPKKASESNAHYSEDFSNFLNSLKEYVKETKTTGLKMQLLGLEAAEMKSIFELLAHPFSKVTELNIEGNNFEDVVEDIFKILTRTKIRTLDVSYSDLIKDNFMLLLEVIKDTQITDLNVSANKIKLDMNETSKLTSFLLGSHVTHLNYEGNKFEPATGALTLVSALPHMSITCLNLGDCSLHSDVLITLFSCIHHTLITDLNVSENEVTDKQIKELGPNLKASKLEKLDLSCNNISDIGMDILAAGLVDSSLVDFDISINKIRGKNSLGRCLKHTKIRELNLHGNDITNRKMFSFPNFLKNSSVDVLRIGMCELGDEKGQKLMCCLKYSNLKELYVQGNSLSSLSLSEFAKNVNETKLTDVDFSDNAFSFPDVIEFAECLKNSKLKNITFAQNWLCSLKPKVVPFVLSKTIGSPITSVDLGGNGMSEVDLDEVANILPNLTISDLQFCFNRIGDNLPRLAPHLKFSSLTHLSLCFDKIDDAGAEALAVALKETQIVELNISANKITDQGASALARGLKDSSLLHLDLSKNKIGNKGFQALAEHAKNTFITVLDISYNPGNRILLIETVLWENRISKHHLVSFFSKIAPAHGDVVFNFNHVMNNFNSGAFLEDLLGFCKTLEQPIAVTVLSEEKSLNLSKSKIVDLMTEEFPQQFGMFVASRIKGTISQHVNILRRAEELGLNKIVEALLLNRPIYTIDESQGILHPYVYKLLFKYKQPLYNLSVEPQSKMKIINYFTDHTEYSDASDVVNMLLKG